jgi:NADH dehydrogenase
MPIMNQPKRVIILGGGFAGVYTALSLQTIWKRDPAIEIILISRTNYFLMTPLLFEAASGVLEPRHSVNPIRPLFSSARFIQGEVEQVDVNQRSLRIRLAQDESQELTYDHLVFALGGVTNTRLIPGSQHAMTFKTLADAIFLRNHTIQRFERADVESDPAKQREQLSFVVVGGGLVGVELMGELTDFVYHVARVYRRIDPKLIRFDLIESGPRILRELDEDLAEYATRVLQKRGVHVHTGVKVNAIDPDAVHLETGESLRAETIIAATGVIPNPLLADLPLPKDRKGRLIVDGTMQVKDHKELWALGDCAEIPDPQGNPYPPLAQHAIREGAALAENITSAIRERPLKPFVYSSKGTLAALGHFRGVGRVYKIRVKGFLAWWIWRSYYLFRMPKWSRRIRIMLDWTIALFVKNDVVQLDLDRVAAEQWDESASAKPPVQVTVHAIDPQTTNIGVR